MRLNKLVQLPGWASVLPLFAGLFLGCGVFGPSSHEDEDDIGSNTNWLRQCSDDRGCGDSLACICGACSQFCAGSEDCPEGLACPVDRSAYQLTCPEQMSDLGMSACGAACDSDAECAQGEFCLGRVCAPSGVQLCPEARRVQWLTEPGQLKARKGGFFGDAFYVPQNYTIEPPDWGEPYQPAELTLLVSDAEGKPLAGCQVATVSEEASGFVYAASPFTNAEGQVSFLWVAGAAAQQSMTARVLGEGNQWLSVSATGEARAHDEEPLAEGAERVSSTAPSELFLNFPSGAEASGIRVFFSPLTFPPRTVYSALSTSNLDVWFTNSGSTDAVDVQPDADFQLMMLRAMGESGAPATLLYSSPAADCSSTGNDTVCEVPDSWLLGEEVTVQVEVRHLTAGEVVPDYDFGEPAACDGSSGCTDYDIYLKRSGGDLVRHAVLRTPVVDALTDRTAYIVMDYREDDGMAPSCLETARSAFYVAHQTQVAGQWRSSLADSASASHETYRNEICANYSVYPRGDGFYLSTGGPSSVSTPHMPGRDLPL